MIILAVALHDDRLSVLNRADDSLALIADGDRSAGGVHHLTAVAGELSSSPYDGGDDGGQSQAGERRKLFGHGNPSRCGWKEL